MGLDAFPTHMVVYELQDCTMRARVVDLSKYRQDGSDVDLNKHFYYVELPDE